MTRKRKRAPATAPASDQQSKCNKVEDNRETARPQPSSSGYANAIISNRHAVLARFTEKKSCIGNQYFVGQIGDAPVVMLRNDKVTGEEQEWTLFLHTPRAKRDRAAVETGAGADDDSGGAA